MPRSLAPVADNRKTLGAYCDGGRVTASSAPVACVPMPDQYREAAARAHRGRPAIGRERTSRRLRELDDDLLREAYEADLRVIMAEIAVAEARTRKILAEQEAWRVAQARRQSVLDEADRLRDEIDQIDWRGRPGVLVRIGAKVQLFPEDYGDPRWQISTRFAVGSLYSIRGSQPFLISPFGEQAPLTIMFGMEPEDGEVDANLYRPLP